MTTSTPETPETPEATSPGAAKVFAERALLRDEDVAAVVGVLHAVATRRARLRRWAVRVLCGPNPVPGSGMAVARGRGATDHGAARDIAVRLVSAGGCSAWRLRRRRSDRSSTWSSGNRTSTSSRSEPTGAAAPVVLARSEALDLVADLLGLAERLARDGARIESLAVEAAGGRILESLLAAGPFEAGWSARTPW